MRTLIDVSVPDKHADLIDELLRFYLRRLVPFHVFDRLTIDIEIDKDIKDIASVIPSEDDLGFPNLNSFELKIRKIDKELASNLAHECVHIKQFALGQLRRDLIVKKADDDSISTEWVKVWNYEDWLPEHYEDSDYDSPWEIEAYGREVGLLRQWKRHKGIVK